MLKLDPINIELIAENQQIKIIPNFNLPLLTLLAGEIESMTPGVPVDVPLWMAINLKQRHKCNIIPPIWLDIVNLEDIKRQETDNQYFTPMPNPHYMEIANLLLKEAYDDIPNHSEIKTLMKDIWDLRMGKLKNSIEILMNSDTNINRIQVNHITQMEINSVRALLSCGLDMVNRLTKLKLAVDEDVSRLLGGSHLDATTATGTLVDASTYGLGTPTNNYNNSITASLIDGNLSESERSIYGVENNFAPHQGHSANRSEISEDFSLYRNKRLHSPTIAINNGHASTDYFNKPSRNNQSISSIEDLDI